LPEIGRIQSTNFQSLLTDLGITRNNIPFGLQSEVMPVVLVGGTVSFVAAPIPAYDVNDIFSLGPTTAPAVNTVLADTGPLPIGAYTVQVVVGIEELQSVELQWRDAPNTANLRLWRLPTSSTQFTHVFNTRLNVQNDAERFRVLNLVAGGVGIAYQVVILAKV